MKLVINAAMVPNEGTFRYWLIDRAAAASWMYESFGWDDPMPASYIGYQQTAEHLAALFCEEWSRRNDSGEISATPPFSVPLNRAKCSMQPGDKALVCRLAYRVENPATKGLPQPEDWEYGILERIA